MLMELVLLGCAGALLGMGPRLWRRARNPRMGVWIEMVPDGPGYMSVPTSKNRQASFWLCGNKTRRVLGRPLELDTWWVNIARKPVDGAINVPVQALGQRNPGRAGPLRLLDLGQREAYGYMLHDGQAALSPSFSRYLWDLGLRPGDWFYINAVVKRAASKPKEMR